MSAPRLMSDMISEMSARLGFNAQTTLSAAVQSQLQWFLHDAQEQLYWQYEWEYLRTFWPTTLVVGQQYYPFSAMIDGNGDLPEGRRIRSVSVVVSNLWTPLREGINPALYTLTTTSIPVRYARVEQAVNGSDTLEIWPTPSTAYVIQVEAMIALRPFAVSTDVTTLDERLVLLFALANAKAHYGMADAGSVMNNAAALLNRLRAANHGQKRYLANRFDPSYIPPLPLFNGTWQN